MKKLMCSRDRKRVSIFKCFFFLIVLSVIGILTKGMSVASADAETTYANLLFQFCTSPQATPGCIPAFPGGPASPITTNPNTLGALGITSNVLARQQRETIEERLEELRKDQNKKNIMPDGGETVETIFGRFGGFAVGQYTDTDRDKTTLENGYDAELKGVMLGFDYRFSDKLTAGVAVSFNDEDADFNADSGHLKTDSWNVTVYGNFAPLKNMYIDAYAGYSNIDYESTRTIIFGALRGTARGTTDGDQFIAGFTAGNDWNFGAFTVGPQLIMDYSTTSIDGYGEKGGVDPLMLLNYGDQTIHSLTTNLGGQASYSQSFSWGVLVPNARLYWVHEYKDGSRRLPKSMSLDSTRSFTVKTDSPDRDYMVFGGGVSTVLPHGVQLFADYDTTFSHEFLHTWTATVGFRKAF